MLVIRFQRVGKKNEPSFRVVLTEKKRGPQRKYLEELGFYNPRKKTVQLKSERILHWLSKGAQASPSCHNLFVKEGVISGSKIPKHKAGIPVAEGDLGIKKGKITAPSAGTPAAADTEASAAPAKKAEEKTETGPENEPKEPAKEEALDIIDKSE